MTQKTTPKPRKPTAREMLQLRPPREKLQISKLRLTQLEFLGQDTDLTDLYLRLGSKGIDIESAVMDITVTRTIEGASTVTVTLVDQDRILLRSGRLSSKQDIQIDGLYFRLVQVSKSGRELTLTFEDREVSVLRTYDKPIKQSVGTSRSKITRAQFILRMIREVKEFKIPYVIPELLSIQPIGSTHALPDQQTNVANRALGIPYSNVCTCKGQTLTENQRRVANIVLDVGASMLLPRKCLVMAVMCATQESSLTNLTQGKPGDFNYLGPNPRGNPVGVFQQIAKYGWPASRDVARDAKAFYDALWPYVQANPNVQYSAAIEHVQSSGHGSAYAQWRTEAERDVTEYGLVSGTSADANSQWKSNTPTADYEFYRGKAPTKYQRVVKKENSWNCIQRLADEVNWRAFFVSGTFYYISEDDLFKSQPIATIDEDTVGIDAIDGDYDEGKKNALLTITCHVGRWAAPPGSVIVIRNMGPWNGRWLINDISRSLFNDIGTITLKKPRPRLPEPSAPNVKSGTGTWTGADPSTDTGNGTGTTGKQFKTGGSLVQPIPRGKSRPPGHNKVHDTLNLPSYPASDFFANPGCPVLAPENGTIVRFSGHDPSLGPVDPITGAHGPLGWSIYLLGDSGSEYYMTHLGSRLTVVGATVRAGQQIATVANYDLYGTESHTHVGVKPVFINNDPHHPESGGTSFTIQDLMNAPQAVG